VASSFSSAGWTGPNGESPDRQGDPGSYKWNILSTLNWLKNNAASVAVVDFDHGVGTSSYSEGQPGTFHYMMEDEEGNYIGNYPGIYEPMNAVYDDEIFDRTNLGEITFAFISTCESGNYYNSLGELNGDYYYQQYGITQGPLPDGTIRGMPYAFMHRIVGGPSGMSSNGYSSPDPGTQVYIGFPKGSPSLTQTLPNLPGNPGSYFYQVWVEQFFTELLVNQRTVHDALDVASNVLWGGKLGVISSI
jgi:hypothetical protein